MIAHPLVLHGKLVRLEPLEEGHVPGLLAISRRHPEVYRFTSTPVTDEQAEAYFGRAFRERELGLGYPFAVFERGTDRLIGSTRFADIRWHHRNCELGYTWFEPSHQGSGANQDSKLLMLGYAFETLKFLRVHFYTDTRNVRSQHAIRALGATQEGLLRCHMVLKDGFVRDSLVFSIVHHEWPKIKRRLEEKLKRKLG